MPQFHGVIRPAVSAEELNSVYELRAKVFFGEDILKLGRSSRLTDDLDDHPNVLNLIVVSEPPGTCETEVVGGVRVAFPGTGLVPAHTPYFDFQHHVPGYELATACGSMLCIRPDFRRSRLASMLVRSAMYLSQERSMRYLCAAVRPRTVPFFTRLGWTTVAPQFDHPVEMVPVTPMIVDLGRGPTSAELLRSMNGILARS